MLFSCCFTLLAWTQTVQVVDKTTQNPIPGAKVTGRGETGMQQVLTDEDGMFQRSDFAVDAVLEISYKSYKTLTIPVQQIVENRIQLIENPTAMDEVIITANRWEQDKMKVPNRINKIEAREIAFQNPQTSADVLENTGYAFVQKSQLAGGSPQLRGFGTNRILLVIDGVRMNNAIYRSGNLQNVISLDANTLENAEILFGPGAVMYGSDALGGVMDFRTTKYQFSKTASPLVHGSILARYSSANAEATKSFRFNYGLKRWAFLTAASFSDYGDLRAGSRGNSAFLRPTYQQVLFGKDTTLVNPNPSVQVNSGYSQWNFIQKIAFRLNERWLLDYSINYSESSNAYRYDRLLVQGSNGNLNFGEWYYGPQRWMMNRLGVTHVRKTAFFDQVRMVAAVQNHTESRHDRRFNTTSLRNQYERVDAYSLNIDLDKKVSDRLSVFYGLEGVVNKIGSTANRQNVKTLVEQAIATRYPDASTWAAFGLYANGRFQLTKQWAVSAGVRYTQYAIRATFDTTLFALPFQQANNTNGAINGSIGLVFNPNETTQFYTNISTGFRAPNIDDIGKVFESGPGLLVVPNPSLKPEYAYNGEIGFVKSAFNRLKVDAAVYYTYLHQALARRNYTYQGQDSIFFDGEMSQVQAIQNLASAYVFGVQAGVVWNIWSGLSLRSTISYQIGKEESLDSARFYPKSHVAPVFGRTTLTYQINKWRFDVYANYNGGVAFSAMPLTEIQDPTVYAKDALGRPFTPAWMTWNVKVGYYPSKYVSVFLGLENITDQLYRTFGSGISAPGRNLIVTLRGSF